MIIHIKKGIKQDKIEELSGKLSFVSFFNGRQHVAITAASVRTLPRELEPITDDFFVMETDIQLASSSYSKEKVGFKLTNIDIGGGSGTTTMITGPCAVESAEQIEECASFVSQQGLKILRAGSYKPRTSPYTFQGLGEDGLKLLDNVRKKYGLQIITEVKDSSHVDLVIEYADIVQIGTKAMFDQAILRRCGDSQKPVLLKRGFGATLQEFVQTAEFIMCRGNEKVILCERGIRTFENKTRFTLDLTGVAFLKEKTRLPIFIDPSHAMGHRYGVPDLTRAAVAMGIDGLLVESHPAPELALSDPAQQLNFEEFSQMFKTLPPVAEAVGRVLQ